MRVNFVMATIFGVVIMFACIWVGILFPIQLSATAWIVILLIYAYVASVLTVWVLLQPRDYLNSYLLWNDARWIYWNYFC